MGARDSIDNGSVGVCDYDNSTELLLVSLFFVFSARAKP